MARHHHVHESCPYCKGEGYFHLLLGGTESCPNCHGTGSTPEPADATVAAGNA